MLYTGSIRDIDKTKYDEIWIIVRSLGNISTGENVYHVPQLSPSYNLFYDYRNWVKQGIWCKKQFNDVYKPRFLEEMKSDTAQQYLNLLRESCKTKDILICCFCNEESMCHRSIVKELIEGKSNKEVNIMRSEKLFKFDKPYANNFKKDQIVTIVDRGADLLLVDNVALCSKKAIMSCGHFIETQEENELNEVVEEYNDFYLLIAGSRSFNNYELLKERCDFFLQNQKGIIHIVSGGARGADTLAEQYARERGYKLHVFPADWNKYGNRAGYIRNEEMHEFIAKESCKRGVICFWDGQSKGTAHNFELSKKYNNPLRIVRF